MTRTIEHNVTLVGINFRMKADARALLARIVAKKPLKLALFREPDNKYDPNAIQVLGAAGAYDGIHLGYIPRETAEVLAPRIDEGTVAVVKATLTELWAPDFKQGNVDLVLEDLS